MYKVLKTINGNKYWYWQRTYRLNGKVKTENKYIGPASSTAQPSQYEQTIAQHRTLLENSQQHAPLEAHIDAMEKLDPYYGLDDRKIRRKLQAQQRKERLENEEVVYGKLKDREARQKAAVRKAKRESKGVKGVNAFMARALARLKK